MSQTCQRATLEADPNERARLSALIEFRHKLVEQHCPIEINDAKVCRIVPLIVDPSLGGQQYVCGSLCANGVSSLDYLAGRVHLDQEQRKIGGQSYHHFKGQAYRSSFRQGDTPVSELYTPRSSFELSVCSADDIPEQARGSFREHARPNMTTSDWGQKAKYSPGSAVGTVIADRPPPKSVQADSRTRLLPWVHDGKTPVGIRVKDTRLGEPVGG
jgi:hypothetical protein